MQGLRVLHGYLPEAGNLRGFTLDQIAAQVHAALGVV